jgi:hypothetical protein
MMKEKSTSWTDQHDSVGTKLCAIVNEKYI